MTMELYNQHKAISDLQQKEEEVLDNHQRVNEFLEKFLPEAKELYNFTNLVDYDQDGKQAAHGSCGVFFLFSGNGSLNVTIW